MFDPYTEVSHYQLALPQEKKQKGKPLPLLNILTYKEDKYLLAHCLELDLVGQGDSENDALDVLADMIYHQIDFAEKNNHSFYHPAPKEYWDKLHKIQANEIRQSLASRPPRSAKEIRTSLERVYA